MKLLSGTNVLHGFLFSSSDLLYPLNIQCMWWWVDQLNSRKIPSLLLSRYILLCLFILTGIQ